MTGWWRRLRGALGLGVVWAGGGAVVGGVIELIANFVPALNRVDMWIPMLALPGFIGGVIFATALGIAARGRTFNDLSFPGMVSLGLLGGVILGGLLVGIGAPPMILLPTTVLSGVGAALSLGIGRMAERDRLPGGTDGSPALDPGRD